ncbi:hypothetical protein ACQPWW_33485 [Micromonospora sp. CA-240977]
MPARGRGVVRSRVPFTHKGDRPRRVRPEGANRAVLPSAASG